MKMNPKVYLLLVVFFLFGCSPQTTMKHVDSTKDLSVITDKAIEVLLNKKIFFGHASVGYNIVEGIDEIKASNNRVTGLNIQEITTPADIKVPGFYHIKNGKNAQPKSK